MLHVQMSRRRKRLTRKVDAALTAAGPPYRLVAVVAHDTPEDTQIEVMPLGLFLTRLEHAAATELVEDAKAWLTRCLGKAKGYYERGLIPEWVTFAEGGAELNTIEPPEGTW